MSSYPRNNLEVADDFFKDCHDLLIRYDRTIDGFSGVKSRRFKCFNDLRSAYECILKAIVAYHQPRDMDRKLLIQTAEKHGHHISSLERSAIMLTAAGALNLEERGELLDKLPVGLRYALDGYDFLLFHEDLYYETIGCDPWMIDLRGYLDRVSKAMNEVLSQHSGIVDISGIPMEELLGERYNKYRDKAQQTAARYRVKKRGA